MTDFLKIKTLKGSNVIINKTHVAAIQEATQHETGTFIFMDSDRPTGGTLVYNIETPFEKVAEWFGADDPKLYDL